MHPILWEYGPIRIGSYGVLLSLAFISAIFITLREFSLGKANRELAWDIFLLAVLGGLVGSRTLYVLETWSEFCLEPWKVLFAPTGFSVIGGYLLALGLCTWRVFSAGEAFSRMADLCAPGMAVGYAVGRLGCIAAGDGCYGVPTLSRFGMTFPHGLVPTLSRESPYLSQLFLERYPGVPLPLDIPVFPTPLFESSSALFLLMILLWYPWKIGSGRRFAFFLGWFGISRFLIEFIRINPPGWLGLNSNQWLSLGILAGAIVFSCVSGPSHTPHRTTGDTPSPHMR